MAVVKAMAKVMIESSESTHLLVATGTGKVAILTQQTIIKQFSPKLYAFLRKRIYNEIIFGLRPSSRHIKCYGRKG